MPWSGLSSAAFKSRATLVWVRVFESRHGQSMSSLLFVPSKNSVICSVCGHDIFGSITRQIPFIQACVLSDRRPVSGIGSGQLKLIVRFLLGGTAGSIRHRARPARYTDH